MVKNDEATEHMSQPAKDGDEQTKKRNAFDEGMFQRNLFMSMALDMTWQLALVVVVPIVGGYALDQHYHRTPWLTIAGFGVAAIGVFGVLSRVVGEAEKRSGYSKPKERS